MGCKKINVILFNCFVFRDSVKARLNWVLMATSLGPDPSWKSCRPSCRGETPLLCFFKHWGCRGLILSGPCMKKKHVTYLHCYCEILTIKAPIKQLIYNIFNKSVFTRTPGKSMQWVQLETLSSHRYIKVPDEMCRKWIIQTSVVWFYLLLRNAISTNAVYGH